MAAYIDVSDVQPKVQHIPINDESDPNATEVSDFVDDIEAQMNARFNSVGIDTPITVASKLAVVQPIAVNGVVACIYRSIDMETEKAVLFQNLYETAMKGIEKRPAILTETGVVSSVPEGSIRTRPLPFHRGADEW